MQTKAWLFAACVAALLSSSAHAHGPHRHPSFYFGMYSAPPIYAARPVFVGPPQPMYVAPGPGPVYVVPPPYYGPPPVYYYPPPAAGISFFFR